MISVRVQTLGIIAAIFLIGSPLLAGSAYLMPASASTLGSITITSVSSSTVSAGQPVTLKFLARDTTGAPMSGVAISIFDKQEGVIGSTTTGTYGTATTQAVLFYIGTNQIYATSLFYGVYSNTVAVTVLSSVTTQTVTSTIKASPNPLTTSHTGKLGAYATLSVTGFSPNEKVQTYLDGSRTSVITVGSTGSGSVLQHYGYVGPGGNTAGTHKISATGLTSGKTATGTITLQ